LKADERALNINGTFALSEKSITLGTLGLSFIKVSMLASLI